MKVKARVVITPDKVVIGEKILIFESSGADLLVEIYKKKVGNYPESGRVRLYLTEHRDRGDRDTEQVLRGDFLLCA